MSAGYVAPVAVVRDGDPQRVARMAAKIIVFCQARFGHAAAGMVANALFSAYVDTVVRYGMVEQTLQALPALPDVLRSMVAERRAEAN